MSGDKLYISLPSNIGQPSAYEARLTSKMLEFATTIKLYALLIPNLHSAKKNGKVADS